MHELSLCRRIYAIADRARGGRTVETIHLEVGHLRQVVPETLEHCWMLVCDGTPLAGSRLEIEHIPIELRCSDCDATTHAIHHLVLTCATCDSADVALVRGEELMVTAMDLRAQEAERQHG